MISYSRRCASGLTIAAVLLVSLTACSGSASLAGAAPFSLPPTESGQHAQARTGGHARYAIVNVGTLGGSVGAVSGINDRGMGAGDSNLSGDGVQHAFLWTPRQGMTDLGTLGGPNSFVAFPFQNSSEIPGGSETAAMDPFAENFCGTPHICLGFVWQDGAMHALATLGGNNGQANSDNSLGQIVGYAETAARDPNCIAPQVFDFEGVIWGPHGAQIEQLTPLTGDTVSAAFGINDRGDAVGGSGVCGPVTPAISLHSVLWHKGSVIDLGTLGGTFNNYAAAINNDGLVVGQSDLPGDSVTHAFMWKRGRLTDLATLPGDSFSAAYSVNDRDQIVGLSCDLSGSCRAVLWQDDAITDLNTLVPPSSSLYLVFSASINNRGEIGGQAFDQSTGTSPAFVAIPHEGSASQAGPSQNRRVNLPGRVREQLQRRLKSFPLQ